MVSEVVADGQVNPIGGFDESWAIGTLLNLLEHILGSNTTSKQDLWGSKGTRRQDDTACRVGQLDRTNMSSIVGCNDFETCCMATYPVDSLKAGVQPEVRVIPSVCGDKVCCHWATTFAIAVHVRSVGVVLVFGTRGIVRCDTCPVGAGESLPNDVEARLDVELPI